MTLLAVNVRSNVLSILQYSVSFITTPAFLAIAAAIAVLLRLHWWCCC